MYTIYAHSPFCIYSTLLHLSLHTRTSLADGRHDMAKRFSWNSCALAVSVVQLGLLAVCHLDCTDALLPTLLQLTLSELLAREKAHRSLERWTLLCCLLKCKVASLYKLCFKQPGLVLYDHVLLCNLPLCFFPLSLYVLQFTELLLL